MSDIYMEMPDPKLPIDSLLDYFAQTWMVSLNALDAYTAIRTASRERYSDTGDLNFASGVAELQKHGWVEIQDDGSLTLTSEVDTAFTQGLTKLEDEIIAKINEHLNLHVSTDHIDMYVVYHLLLDALIHGRQTIIESTPQYGIPQEAIKPLESLVSNILNGAASPPISYLLAARDIAQFLDTRLLLRQ
jgi:hypothetical protein